MFAARASEDGDVLEVSEQDLLDAATILYGGRYELLSLVGAGAYGSVYRARDTELDEVVAVKVLRYEHLSQPGTLERFRREVRLARRVAHQNVARTFDIGRHAGERFLTMEYIQGHPLTRLCPINASLHELLPIRIVIEIAMQLCSGLAALHAAGIVHQDMKTDNVLVSNDARVAITDFGIARALEGGDAEQSITGQLIGTPAYMAPEQVRGNGRIDTRADLYALGIMLFQMLTGQLPFNSRSGMEAALARLYQAPADAMSIRPQLPSALNKLLSRCLAREPDERFQTADELSASLSAERPSGPDLVDYLKTRAAASRSTAMSFIGPVPGAPFDATLVAPHHGDALTAMSGPPLPRLDGMTETRQLAVAVLVFRWVGQPGDEYLPHGLTEELIDRLSDSESLRIISYQAVRGLMHETRDLGEVGLSLGVKVVLDGTLRMTATGLLATVRLVDVDSKLQFAARRFERADRNILALAMEAAHSIGDLLTVSLSQSHSELVKDPLAVDLYLRARHHYNRMTTDGVRKSITLLEEALVLLPEDPTLITWQAMALSRAWFFGGERAGERAMEAAMHAVRVAPGHGDAYMALSTVLLGAGRYEEAAVAVRKALALSPKLVEAHELLGQFLGECGPLELAERHLNYALMLDRNIPRVRISLARAAVLQGRQEDAVSLLKIDGTDPAYVHIMWISMTRLLSWTRDIVRIREMLDDPAVYGPHLADVLPRLQHIAGERHVELDEYVPKMYRTDHASLRARQFATQIIVEFHCTGRSYDLAFGALRELVGLGVGDLMWLDHCPLIAPLRDYEGYAALRTAVSDRAQRVLRALGLSAT